MINVTRTTRSAVANTKRTATRAALKNITNSLHLHQQTKKRRKSATSATQSKKAKTQEGRLWFDVYRIKMDSELKFQPHANYMSEVQKDISHTMRSILIDWLIEVASEYKLAGETLFLTVNYIDRFLSLVPIHREKLQLLGVTAMFVASKYEEVDPPRLDEFVYICDNTYTKAEVLRMEACLLNTLNFSISSITSRSMLSRLLCNFQLKPCARLFAHFINEMFLQHCASLEFRPSLAAVSSIYIALCMESQQAWPDCLSKISHYTQKDAMPCITELLHMCRLISSSKLKTVFLKYKELWMKNYPEKAPLSTLLKGLTVRELR